MSIKNCWSISVTVSSTGCLAARTRACALDNSIATTSVSLLILSRHLNYFAPTLYLDYHSYPPSSSFPQPILRFRHCFRCSPARATTVHPAHTQCVVGTMRSMNHGTETGRKSGAKPPCACVKAGFLRCWPNHVNWAGHSLPH